MKELLHSIHQCIHCADKLPHPPNPVLAASPSAQIIIIGQAPGRIVDQTGIPWDDLSGQNLRSWLAIDSTLFYDTSKIALIPMGFCYPGTGKNGDLPPMKDCAKLWHPSLFQAMPHKKLILLIGQYAQKYYLGQRMKKNLTETVLHFHEYLPAHFPLPHPSPRNNRWQARNPWFEKDVLPVLKEKVNQILSDEKTNGE